MKKLISKTAKIQKITVVESLSELREIIGKRNEDNSGIVDLTDIDVSKLKELNWIFSYATDIKKINISGWNIRAISLSHMFYDCLRLEEIIGIGDLNLHTVKFIDHMFTRCKSLKHLDLSKWDVSKIESAYSLFSNCSSLEEIKGVEDEQWSKIPKKELMFNFCKQKVYPEWFLKNLE